MNENMNTNGSDDNYTSNNKNGNSSFNDPNYYQSKDQNNFDYNPSKNLIVDDDMIDNSLKKLLDQHKYLEDLELELNKNLSQTEAHKKTLISSLCNDETTFNISQNNQRKIKGTCKSDNFSNGSLIMISYSKSLPGIINTPNELMTEQMFLNKNINYKAFRIFRKNFKNKHNKLFEIYTTTIYENNKNEGCLEIVDSENNASSSFREFASLFDDFPFNINSWLYFK